MKFLKDQAWGAGWKQGYYHPDDPAQCPFTDPLQIQWFEFGAMAGFEALEEIEPLKAMPK